MKTFRFIVIGLFTFTGVAFASDCRVIEYPDHNEVVCDGESIPAVSDSKKDAERAEDLLNKIKNLKREYGYITKITGKETPEVLSQIVSERRRVAKEIVIYDAEHAELTIKDPKKLETTKRTIYGEYELLEKAMASYQSSVITESKPKIKISDINALEVKRGYSYAYFSVRAEVDNITDKPLKGSFVLQAKNYDDHVVESVNFYFKLDKKETRMLAEEKMIRLDLLPVIRKWVAEKIEVY